MTPGQRRVLVIDDRGDDDGWAADVADALARAGFSAQLVSPAGEPAAVAGSGRAGETAGGAVVPERRREREQGVPIVVLPGDLDTMSGVGPFEAALAQRPPVRQPPRRVAPNLVAGDIVVDEAGRLALRSGLALDLTRREFDLLAHLVRHGNRVVSRHELRSSVWCGEAVTPNAIEAQVSKLRIKLEAVGPPVIHTVRGVGYVLRIAGVSPFDAWRDAMVADRDRILRDRDAVLARRDEVRRLRSASGAGPDTTSGADAGPVS